MTISIKEALRYLGYGKNKANAQILMLIDECIEEVKKASEPRHIYRRFPLELVVNGKIKAGNLEVTSHSLTRNLRDCDEVLFFAATLGNAPDIIMNRYSRLSIGKAAVFQAVAAAAIEGYCNECQDDIEKKMLEEQLYLRPRFSPGYGDFSLDVQGDFLKMLDAQKTVGIYLSEGNLMLPEKSVTALIGLSREKTKCKTEPCEKKDCTYRR